VAERDEENKTRYMEVPFGRADAIRQFDGAFLTHGNLVFGDVEKSRTSWLQNRIVWEPVDGQHIVVACHLTTEDFLQGRMTTEVYNSRVVTRTITDGRSDDGCRAARDLDAL
jgi:hypothetical protein